DTVDSVSACDRRFVPGLSPGAILLPVEGVALVVDGIDQADACTPHTFHRGPAYRKFRVNRGGRAPGVKKGTVRDRPFSFICCGSRLLQSGRTALRLALGVRR